MNPTPPNTSTLSRFAVKVASTALLPTLAVLAVAHPAQAFVSLYATPGTPIGHGLVSYTLGAFSTAGETINGIDSPDIVPYLGGTGLHQVWTPITNSATPTRQEQLAAGILWSDTWRPYDSYWFFDGVDNLSVGASFTETSSMSGGATLPSAGFGPPTTGFGSMGTAGNLAGAKAYTIASGLQGDDVQFAQLVLNDREFVSVALTVLSNSGIIQVFDEFLVGGCCTTLFQVDDLFLGGCSPPGCFFQGGPLPTNDDDDPDAGIIWELENFVGPGGSVVGATVDPNTGIFSWQSLPSSKRGNYIATIRGTNDNTPTGTDTGILSFWIPVPEPATATLLILAMCAVGFIRRR